MSDVTSFSIQFKNTVEKLLNDKNIRILHNEPKGVKFVKFRMGVLKPNWNRIGKDKIINSLARSLLGFIEEFSKNESCFVFFKDSPDISPYRLDDLTFCYKAECRIGIKVGNH